MSDPICCETTRKLPLHLGAMGLANGNSSEGSAREQSRSVQAFLDFLAERVVDCRGEESMSIHGVAKVTPGAAGCLSFSSLRATDALDQVTESRSSVILVRPEVFNVLPELMITLIAVEQPRREYARLVQHFFVGPQKPTVSPSAFIDPDARIGHATTVEPGAYIAGNVTVGSYCAVGANAVLLPNTTVGDHSRIGPNCTIGHVGFGYAREESGLPVEIPHLGGVRIGSFVEVGANTCIDRGTIEDTVIDDYVKVDNLVHIAHNCVVESGAFVIATAILCGGVRIGPRAWIAPNASIREQLTVGEDAVVGLSATVVRDVPAGVTVVGSPAREVRR